MSTDNPVPRGHEPDARLTGSDQRSDYRRLTRALDAFARVAGESADANELSTRLLALFADATCADVAMICVRTTDGLRVLASIGLELPADFHLPVAACGDAAAIGAALPRQAETLPNRDTARCRIALQRGAETIGMIYLATRRERALLEEGTAVLSALAPMTAVALERQLAQAALAQAVQARDQVLAVVAHDLRNPLNVISLAANTLLQRAEDAVLRRPVERILRGAQRADRLIQDLLEINAIEGGRFAIDRRQVGVARIVLAALESQQSIAAKASIILQADLSPNLSAIEGDPERLLEVLENLIGNAVKFTDSGGSITVGASERDDEVVVWVKDNGCGITPEQLPYLFDRFWQAGRSDRRGTGLGLTICKAIVEAHDGQIWAESNVGAGTTMFFSIPAAARGRTAHVAERSNILLVDDRPENLLSLKAILEQPNYRLVTAASGEEALRLALRERFELALIDIAMPGMNGLEVAVHLKELERSRDIPIIFITAFGDDPEEIHRAYSAGGADYLVKPLDAEIVRKKVAVFIDLYRRHHDI